MTSFKVVGKKMIDFWFFINVLKNFKFQKKSKGYFRIRLCTYFEEPMHYVYKRVNLVRLVKGTFS